MLKYANALDQPKRHGNKRFTQLARYQIIIVYESAPNNVFIETCIQGSKIVVYTLEFRCEQKIPM